jgi:hypothetical protein
MQSRWVGVALIAACSQTVPPVPAKPLPAMQTSFTHDASFASVWNATLDTLHERGIAIVTIDKQSGILLTEWVNLEDDDEVEDRYAECDPGLSATYGVRTRMDIRVKAGPPTTLSIKASFAEYRSNTGPRGDDPCESRGRLEREINEEIGRRAARTPPPSAPRMPMT